MAEEMTFLPRDQILSLEEIYLLAKTFVELGVTKIRITGGEPLVRKGALDLLQNIGALAGLHELVMTTNGSQLLTAAPILKAANVKRINISLDTLDAQKFKAITRTGDLQQVLNGIDEAINAGFERIKLNAVILKNRNHDEVSDLVQFAIEKEIEREILTHSLSSTSNGCTRPGPSPCCCRSKADWECGTRDIH
jgi:cyclic pyranopterin phosphate synthase